jgi:uncharacterized protein YndB with AHSA1/START domain
MCLSAMLSDITSIIKWKIAILKTFSISKTITIKSSPEKIFDALTTSSEIIKYYPLNKVSSTWNKGESVNYHGEVEGQAFTDFGVITEMKRPLQYSYEYWSDNHGTENTPDNHLTIDYMLSFVDGFTQLKLTQSNIKSKEMFNIMNDVVWDMLLNGLKNHIESK